jgi:hypothetical protein
MPCNKADAARSTRPKGEECRHKNEKYAAGIVNVILETEMINRLMLKKTDDSGAGIIYESSRQINISIIFGGHT